jgi:outer membrane protein TolC
MKPSNTIATFFLLVLLPFAGTAAQGGLSLRQAEQVALQYDPVIKSHQQHARAFEDESVAAGEWPDPKLKFGFLSLPTDSFELDQEPMTQVVLGYQQALPRGDSTSLMAAARQAQAGMKHADVALRQRMVLLNTRKAWYQTYLQDQSMQIIEQNRRLVRQQLQVSQSLYAAGKSQQQDVLQAELELSLMDDRLQQIASMQSQSRAMLAKWVGDELADMPLGEPGDFARNALQKDVDELLSILDQHPELKRTDAKIQASEKQVDLAMQQYKPQWSFDLTYGKRDGFNMDGTDRADFFSALVLVDLPLFTEQNQDRILSARRSQLLAERYGKTDTRLSLAASLKQAYARYTKLQQRVQLYDRQVLPQARQNASAAFNGYQSGVVSFIALTRARSAELKAELQHLNLMVEQAIAYAEIRFLVGEDA